MQKILHSDGQLSFQNIDSDMSNEIKILGCETKYAWSMWRKKIPISDINFYELRPVTEWIVHKKSFH